ncbi:hypothetical protein TNCV_3849021 [Trichonephila clavipes]|uniref:Uncharacterized protein n=1 Tax=Trichonephila clavipes TaxID=2585209 RepID=A0A8X6RJ25_TRICX|nr:hypothetical protein TNCV_3849021 [Trichonephila clavipes]
MEESEHGVKSLELLKLHMVEFYLAEKLPQEDCLGKVLEGGVTITHTHTNPLRFYDHNYRGQTIVGLVPRSRPLRLLYGQCVTRQRLQNCTVHHGGEPLL